MNFRSLVNLILNVSCELWLWKWQWWRWYICTKGISKEDLGSERAPTTDEHSFSSYRDYRVCTSGVEESTARSSSALGNFVNPENGRWPYWFKTALNPLVRTLYKLYGDSLCYIDNNLQTVPGSVSRYRTNCLRRYFPSLDNLLIKEWGVWKFLTLGRTISLSIELVRSIEVKIKKTTVCEKTYHPSCKLFHHRRKTILLLLSSEAADAAILYQINVILWALDRARTLDFFSTKALRTLPSWISH